MGWHYAEAVCRRRRQLDSFIGIELLPKVTTRAVRESAHFRQWWRVPMNYVRMMELPATLEFLELERARTILDIGSPKLLALYLMKQPRFDVTITDLNDYFVKDFAAYQNAFECHARLEVFDARDIPHSALSFDRVFSVSTLEHIPGDGDTLALKEIARVLKSDGIGVVTLPVARAYIEEWQRDPAFYWVGATVENDKREVFFQRRHDHKSLTALVDRAGLRVEDHLYIAEQPIREPAMSDNGVLLHNFHYCESSRVVRAARCVTRLSRAPLLQYLSYRYLSNRYHYLTQDGTDPNVRQVVLKLRRAE